ncbi:uncharacterized protein BDR25DRAFT_352124 [Lindgomyces ingoldianus]|uniref:Uncharacterized protein n=1 Tax=Lindgomyces ingoldianus TaxID=673940 RepID=A0ACB6R4E1_9PLEO|nr:uncharacterized protein BDR25DRAFT_352124 [Lindgomyces ingoldianus]KAF2473635.1 hypothetical protein BDR25DRAFT_352124 [Lindgomyces ingoldianus]
MLLVLLLTSQINFLNITYLPYSHALVSRIRFLLVGWEAYPKFLRTHGHMFPTTDSAATTPRIGTGIASIKVAAIHASSETTISELVTFECRTECDMEECNAISLGLFYTYSEMTLRLCGRILNPTNFLLNPTKRVNRFPSAIHRPQPTGERN